MMLDPNEVYQCRTCGEVFEVPWPDDIQHLAPANVHAEVSGHTEGMARVPAPRHGVETKAAPSPRGA